jgi:hypothetical protein
MSHPPVKPPDAAPHAASIPSPARQQGVSSPRASVLSPQSSVLSFRAAEFQATVLQAWLDDTCSYFVSVGELRRRCPRVVSLEHIAIERTPGSVAARLEEAVRERVMAAEWIASSPSVLSPQSSVLRISFNRLTHTLYLATEATLAALLITRTGPVSFVNPFLGHLRTAGYRLDAGRLIRMDPHKAADRRFWPVGDPQSDEQLLPCASEEQLLDLAGMPFVPPEARQ